MKIGDLIIDRSEMGRMGLIVSEGFTSLTGTPFDWTILYINGEVWGADSRCLELVCK